MSEDWLRVERERLRGIWIGVLDKLVRHYEDTDASRCIRVATQLLAAEPLREDVHRVLMRAYAGQNRLTLALDQYERCRAELQRHLRIQPESETQELYLRIKAQRMAGSSKNLDQWSPEQRPQTRYVNVGGISIAYQVTGNGPVDRGRRDDQGPRDGHSRNAHARIQCRTHVDQPHRGCYGFARRGVLLQVRR